MGSVIFDKSVFCVVGQHKILFFPSLSHHHGQSGEVNMEYYSMDTTDKISLGWYYTAWL